MTSVKPPTVRFSGYRYDQQGKPELFLPGFKNAGKVQAEILSSPEADAGNPERIDLQQDSTGQYWRATNNSKLQSGTAYRFVAQDKKGNPIAVPLDFLETVTVQNSKTKQADTFNRIAMHDLKTPQKSSVIADIYADSILTQDQIKALDERGRAERKWENVSQDNRLPVLPMRNHFNKFNKITLKQPIANREASAEASEFSAKAATQGYEDGLNELVPELKNLGFSAVLFKPFIGGDNLSSHRYWTTDPYILNDTFRNKNAFRKSLDTMLENGMKVFADGAFVNQGMNGVQIMSNLRNRADSPYWGNWFHFGENETGDRKKLPSLAQQPYKFGVLPTETKNGATSINFEAFAIRVINNPASDEYNAVKPTFIELYDPRLEDAQGKPKPLALNAEDTKGLQRATAAQLKDSRSSVQKYRFPVDPKALKAKMASSDNGLHPNAKYLDWENFSLTAPSEDHSSKKWDGQLDVALMNTKSQEVVDYLEGAVNYWSRMVMNHYTNQVAQKMGAAKQKIKDKKLANHDDSPVEFKEILEAVTQKTGTVNQADPLAILPPDTHDVDRSIAKKAEAFATSEPDYDIQQTGKSFAHSLLKNVPLNTIPFPILFKANLNDLQFLKSIPLHDSKIRNFIEDQLLALIDIPYVGKPFELLSQFLFSPRLEKALGRKMQQVFNELSQSGEASEKLRHEGIQSIVADQLGEKLYVSLITGKSLKESGELIQNPEELEKAFYESVPPSMIQAPPQEAARRLSALFRQRLRELNYPGPNNTPSLQVQIREEVENIVKPLDPSLVNLAANVLKEREFGLNWRIDAAKDVANIDEVRSAPNKEEALKRFKKEVEYLNQFWGEKLGDAMRSVFPKASVIAELTDFGTLARDDNDSQNGQTLKKNLFVNNTFTSTPNMEHTYSPLLQLTHYAQRPDEFGASQMTPSHFLKNHVQKMTQEVPLFAQRNAQNMSASHDFSTTSHALLVNPELFNQDRNAKQGLMEFMDQGLYELQHMACFANERETLKTTLGVTTDEQLKTVLSDFRTWLKPSSNANIPGSLALKKPDWPEEIYNADHKAALWDEKTDPNKHYLRGPVPMDLKKNFPSQVLELLTERLEPEKGVLTNPRSILGKLAKESPALSHPDAEQRKAALEDLKTQLENRIGESGEVKAMRGVINNAVVSVAQSNDLLKDPKAQNAIWKGLNQAIEEWGTNFGYQPLETALNHVFEKANPALITQNMTQAQIEQLKLNIYNTALKPVLPKLERIYAIQNALPGNPSVYLPDLFAQGGSELQNNMYGQNRSIIRADRLKKGLDNAFDEYLTRVGQMFNSRKKLELEVLNDGIVLPVETDDSHGILPIIRDNGTQQAIVLIDTGKPGISHGQKIPALDTDDAQTNQYSNVTGEWLKPNRQTTKPLLLKSAHLQAGATYTDHETKERFKLKEGGILVKIADDGTTETPEFEIKPNRILVREEPPKN